MSIGLIIFLAGIWLFGHSVWGGLALAIVKATPWAGQA